METVNDIALSIDRSARRIQGMSTDPIICATLLDVATRIASALSKGGKVLFCGNGGSAADAQHWAGELVSRFHHDRPPLAAVALTTDSSVLSAIGNDYGFADVFARQVRAIGRSGDVLIAISTSGNSANVLAAVDVARDSGMLSVGFTGRGGGRMAARCDLVLQVPSDSTPEIQECHAVLGHVLCGIIEHMIYPAGRA